MARKSAYLEVCLYIFGLLNISVVPTVPVVFGDIFYGNRAILPPKS